MKTDRTTRSRAEESNSRFPSTERTFIGNILKKISIKTDQEVEKNTSDVKTTKLQKEDGTFNVL